MSTSPIKINKPLNHLIMNNNNNHNNNHNGNSNNNHSAPSSIMTHQLLHSNKNNNHNSNYHTKNNNHYNNNIKYNNQEQLQQSSTSSFNNNNSNHYNNNYNNNSNQNSSQNNHHVKSFSFNNQFKFNNNHYNNNKQHHHYSSSFDINHLNNNNLNNHYHNNNSNLTITKNRKNSFHKENNNNNVNNNFNNYNYKKDYKRDNSPKKNILNNHCNNTNNNIPFKNNFKNNSTFSSNSAPTSNFSNSFDNALYHNNNHSKNGNNINNTNIDELLDDLCIRFIINSPMMEDFEDELNQLWIENNLNKEMNNVEAFLGHERLFFNLEEAFWFYLDHYKNRNLPKFKFITFCELMFQRCPTILLENTIYKIPNLTFNNTNLEKNMTNHGGLIQNQNIQQTNTKIDFQYLVDSFLRYKTSIPVKGCILLNEDLTKVILVQSWNTKSWSFPKGKINKNESEVACAIREVHEECGFDCSNLIKENDFIEIEENYAKESTDSYKHSNPNTKLFIVMNVNENYKFETKTRKEILKIKWFTIDELTEICNSVKNSSRNGSSNSIIRTWLVKPFLEKLKEFIKSKKATNKEKNILKLPKMEEMKSKLSDVSFVVDSTNNENCQSGNSSPLLQFQFNAEEIVLQ